MRLESVIEVIAGKVAARHKVPVSDALRAAVKAGIQYEIKQWCNPPDYHEEVRREHDKWKLKRKEHESKTTE